MPLLDFPVFSWVRDLLGIRKDIIDTRKSKLEVQKLQDEELDRNFITRATIADIEKYDPKYERIKAAAMSGIEDSAGTNIRKHHWLVRLFGTFFGIVCLLSLIFVLYNFILRVYKALFK